MSAMTSTAKPYNPATGGHVDFNENIISGAKLTGGYTAYQLWPGGMKIKPVTKSSEPMTIANVSSLFCYKQDDTFDLFLPRARDDFAVGEIVELQGPIRNPENPTMEFVQMTGLKSSTSLNFYLVTSTIGGSNTGSTIPQPGAGSYKITITVESAGAVVFSSTATI